MQLPESGALVGEKYRILRALGEGGMGTIFEAQNVFTLRRTAIKWLHPHLAATKDAPKRLLHEARAMARVHHENVVEVYDVVSERDAVFLVMELLEGEPLSAHVARHTLALHDYFALLCQAMRGLAAAHAAGVIHRDVKPGNIFLARNQHGVLVPKVIDFGISRMPESGDSRITHSDVTMGTPRYVSFEQLHDVRDVDARTDVYAFGVMLYEALVGRPPHEADTLGAQALSFVTTTPPAPHLLRTELSEALSRLVMNAITRDREQRIPSLNELVARLAPYCQPEAFESPLLCRHRQRNDGSASGLRTSGVRIDSRATIEDDDVPSQAPASLPAPPPSVREELPVHAAATAKPMRVRRWPSVLRAAFYAKAVLLALGIAYWAPRQAEVPGPRAATLAGARSGQAPRTSRRRTSRRTRRSRPRVIPQAHRGPAGSRAPRASRRREPRARAP